MSRLDYLFTEFRVIVTYIRLLIIPVNQNFDYDYPAYGSFFNPNVFLSLFLLLSIVGLGVFLLRRGHRLPAFGIFWFFLTLSVESSLIPIVDVIFEHRVYLPSVGAFIAITSALFAAARSERTGGLVAVLLLTASLALAGASYARNAVWRDPVALWEDAAGKSPRKARAHLHLGIAYAERNLKDKAVEHLRVALRLNPNDAKAHLTLGTIYAAMGLQDEAMEHLAKSITLGLRSADAHYNLGVLYSKKMMPGQAEKHFKTALAIKQDHVEALGGLAAIYLDSGFVDRAIEHYRRAVELRPDANAHYRLARAYAKKGLTGQAEEHFRKADQLMRRPIK
jgi:tetratricopeptide (TPR) repeat protein